jgi:excisionase family DNA binding protein
MEDMLYVCKEFLTTNEAVKYLSICKFTLLEAVRRREIPYYTPPSKTYYFAKADLDAWVNSYRVPTQKEMDETLEKQFKHFKPSNKRYRKE